MVLQEEAIYVSCSTHVGCKNNINRYPGMNSWADLLRAFSPPLPLTFLIVSQILKKQIGYYAQNLTVSSIVGPCPADMHFPIFCFVLRLKMSKKVSLPRLHVISSVSYTCSWLGFINRLSNSMVVPFSICVVSKSSLLIETACWYSLF